MVRGGCKGVLESVITFRRCDTPQGGVKDVRIYKCALGGVSVVRKNGHVGGVKGYGKV